MRAVRGLLGPGGTVFELRFYLLTVDAAASLDLLETAPITQGAAVCSCPMHSWGNPCDLPHCRIPGSASTLRVMVLHVDVPCDHKANNAPKFPV